MFCTDGCTKPTKFSVWWRKWYKIYKSFGIVADVAQNVQKCWGIVLMVVPGTAGSTNLQQKFRYCVGSVQNSTKVSVLWRMWHKTYRSASTLTLLDKVPPVWFCKYTTRPSNEYYNRSVLTWQTHAYLVTSLRHSSTCMSYGSVAIQCISSCI